MSSSITIEFTWPTNLLVFCQTDELSRFINSFPNQAVAGTPGMIGYGLAKAAVHQLTASLAEEKSGKSITVIRTSGVFCQHRLRYFLIVASISHEYGR